MPLPFDRFDPLTARYHGENAVALAHAARLAYTQDAAACIAQAAKWGFPKARPIDARETQCLVMGNASAVVVAFRGTEPAKLQDWMSDLDVDLVPGPFGRVHDGFQRALAHVWDTLGACVAEFQDQGQSLWVTGHSLGAALGTLACAHWREADKPVHGLYTFGAPRTGDRDFERTFNQDFGARNFRFVNNADLVTRVPLREMGYSHAGKLVYFDDKGKLQTDPGWWSRFLNHVQAHIADLGRPGLAGIKAHSMDRYVKQCEKNRAAQPF
ncbi:MAG: lipase family protein [Immundisolibacter sp.]|uniref:lipase family protein n=1 Tax=Immundisolibacter sp. TaxID=1934948 RepID=UPI003D0B9F1D